MKRAHASGKLKGKAKKPMTRKAFVKLLDKIDRQSAKPWEDPLVTCFYEMIEPLDKEVSELRAKVSELRAKRTAFHVLAGTTTAKLGNELDAALKANEGLYDRLMLALDGGRPAKGVLTSFEALAPFASYYEKLVAITDDQLSDDRVVSSLAGVLETGEKVEGVLAFGHLHDAKTTYDWMAQGKIERKK